MGASDLMTDGGFSPYSPANRIYQILDALAGSAMYSASTVVTIHPLIDCIKLLVQQPLVISFFDDQLTLRYCSLPDFSGAHTTIKATTDIPSMIPFRVGKETVYYLAIHLPVRKNTDTSCTPLTAPDEIREHYRQLVQQIERDQDLCVIFRVALDLLGEVSPAGNHVGSSSHTMLTPEEYMELLKPVRTVFDEALEQMHETPLLFNAPDGSGRRLAFPNLFFVVQKSAAARQNNLEDRQYSSHIVLSNQQRNAIEAWRTSVPEACVVQKAPCSVTCPAYAPHLFTQYLEDTLDALSAYIPETVISSGTIEFCPALDRPAAPTSCTEDSLCSPVACIHAQIGLDMPQTLSIPIHIGGVPWVTLYTVTPPQAGSEIATWRHNYHFYRYVGRTLVSILRSGIQRSYFIQVSAILESDDCYRNGDLHCEQLNLRWQRLAAVYPFDQVAITPEKPGDEPAITIKSCYSPKSYYLYLTPNCNFSRQMSHTLNTRELAACCEAALLRADERVDVVNRKFTEHIMQQGHTVKNMLCPVTNNLNEVLDDFSEILLHLERLHRHVCQDGGCKFHHSLEKQESLNILTDCKYSVDVLSTTLQILLSPTAKTPDGLQEIDNLAALISWFMERNLSCHPPIEFIDLHNSPVRLRNLTASFTALWNLLHNAANHSDDDSIPIRITLSRNSADNTVLTISNDGKMPPLDRDILIGCALSDQEQAYRGLPIAARKIAEAGWQVVDVVVGNGTTVCIDLTGGLIDEHSGD